MMELNGNQYSAFIPKEDPELPSCYGITFELRNGTRKTFEVVSHAYLSELRAFEIVTQEEEVRIEPMEVIAEISFDKRWLKILEIRQKNLAK